MRLPRIAYPAWLILVAVAAAGCGSKLVKVEGTVTLDGQPVQGATVIFFSESGGPQANGLTDDDGKFKLTTFNTGDGAIPGSYKVTVSKQQVKTETTVGVKPDDPDSMHKAIGGFIGQDARTASKKAQQSTLPADYADQTKTPLKYQVPTGGSIDIKLSSKGGS
jgi:hypothetical protein